MGNGTIVPSLAVWKGRMQIKEVTVGGEFEVFDSGGSWAFLLGKPMLRAFQAKQAYGPDSVSIRDENNKKVLLNNEIKELRLKGDSPGMNLTLDVKQCVVTTGGSSEMKPPPIVLPKFCSELLRRTRTNRTEP